MGFFGSGGPRIVFLDADGTAHKTIDLPHPSSRKFLPILNNDPSENPITKNMLERRFGFRFRYTFRWNSPGTSLDDLIEIANTTFQIRLHPHNETLNYNFYAYIADVQTDLIMGKVDNDAFEITFESIKLFSKIPDFDQWYTFDDIMFDV